MNIYCNDFSGIHSISSRVKEKALSFPSEFIKFPLMRGERESGLTQSLPLLTCSVVLPEILGSLHVINRTSAEFSRKKDVEQSNCYK